MFMRGRKRKEEYFLNQDVPRCFTSNSCGISYIHQPATPKAQSISRLRLNILACAYLILELTPTRDDFNLEIRQLLLQKSKLNI